MELASVFISDRSVNADGDFDDISNKRCFGEKVS